MIAALLCLFRRCRLVHVVNADNSADPFYGSYGIYQCAHCRRLAIGPTFWPVD